MKISIHERLLELNEQDGDNIELVKFQIILITRHALKGRLTIRA